MRKVMTVLLTLATVGLLASPLFAADSVRVTITTGSHTIDVISITFTISGSPVSVSPLPPLTPPGQTVSRTYAVAAQPTACTMPFEMDGVPHTFVGSPLTYNADLVLPFHGANNSRIRFTFITPPAPPTLRLAANSVIIDKFRDNCATGGFLVGGTLCDSATQSFRVDSVRVTHSGDADIVCSVAPGASALVGQILAINTCATDSGRGFLKICANSSASPGDTATCTITFYGEQPGQTTGAPPRIIAVSATIPVNTGGSTGAQVVPTLTQWGLVIFGVILAATLTYIYYLRRRKTRLAA